ncbi:precorrin-6A/cobalt-precorrin-6A reductase [Cyanobium sp. CH-040]|uniref:precorrin-6A/cobalt-precorrin-6A reductase n=1 Tax=Cyanobium sp. CH-040 TaxID=2823708 RepID=UPI0020CE0150|nr:precorrin-6A/cobalt-precorrin-6A reductase [Cyanobium sp. CH-040]MCP9928118.1 precorrin-6A/cobalt-precorrin-6A reductase [Cyanobium sp. CH-040]
MHDPPARPQPGRLWLFSGTGTGPPLAARLLALGWRVRVSVVTGAAARKYPDDPALELQVGPLGGAARLTGELQRAQAQGQPFRVVVDATHPFASRIQHELAEGSAAAAVPLLRLERDMEMAAAEPAGPHGGDCRLSGGGVGGGGAVEELADLGALRAVPLAGSRLLLAIGSRHLAEALRCSPGALHHARVLPHPQALRLALAAGVPPHRLAPLHPRPPGEPTERDEGGVEAALVRRWGIAVILARASGPPSETLWRRVAATEGCRLLLLRRPQLPRTTPGLDAEALLRTLAAWND